MLSNNTDDGHRKKNFEVRGQTIKFCIKVGRREVRRWGQRYPCSENFENLNILYFQVHFETLSGQVNCQLQAILKSVSFLNLHTRKNHLQPRKWSSSNGNTLLQLFNQNCRKKVEK